MISEEIRARYLARFIPVARQRLQRCRAAIESQALADGSSDGTSDGSSELSFELHALAGEAATLGLVDLAAVVRTSEQSLRAGGRPAAEIDRLDRIEAALAKLSTIGREH
jgi:HPt (histidine-containing phosphotransfer) domain-containing protein